MIATIEKIENSVPHPEADRLDVVSVLGYTCVVPKGKFKIGEKVVYIQPDTVLPKSQLWAEPYLKYAATRVKATKLNSKFSVWSNGIVVTFDELEDFKLDKLPVGTEVSNIIGVTKYESPQSKDMRAVGGLPYSIPKTNEERYNNLRNIPYGVKCDVTRKIDGSSMSVGYNMRDDKFFITSRSLNLKLPRKFSKFESTLQSVLYKLSKYKKLPKFGKYIYQIVNYLENKFDLSTEFTHNEFTQVAENLDLAAKVKEYCKLNAKSLVLRGECYGNNINASKPNMDAKQPLGFALYSVYDIDKHEYYLKDSDFYFEKVGKDLDIPTVEMLESDVELTESLIRKYETAPNLNGKLFEGVVIKTQDLTFKVINLPYDLAK